MENEIQYVDRYTILGRLKGIPNGCTGQCEGTSLIPVNLPTNDARLAALWRACEIKHATDDGWHFVPCPECNPEATLLLRLMNFPASATPLHGESDISGDRSAVAQEKEQ